MKYGTRTGVIKKGNEEAFAEAARIGFDGLEFDLQRDYTNDMLWQESGRRRLLELASETGVEVASVCLGALWGHTFASDDVGERERAQEIVTQAARFTPQLGTRVILVPIAGVQDQSQEVGAARWVEGMKACAAVAEETGAILALENVGRSPARSAGEILHIVRRVNSPAVRVYYDIGNAMSFGFDPVRELRELNGLVAQVHVKGAHSAQLYEDTVDLAAVARTLQEIGYDGYLVFETRATETPSETAAENLRIIREHIAVAYG